MEAAENREIELKFLIGVNDLATVEGLPLLRADAGEARRTRVETIYFDTPDQDLWKRGFSLRIRKTGDRFVETIKQETASLIVRGEWESEARSEWPDLDLAEATPLAGFIGKPRVRAALRRVFAVVVERRAFTLTLNGAVVEAVIDDGYIDAEGKRLAVCELELELKAGDRAVLYDLARAVSAKAPVQSSFISKAERGFRLAKGAWGHAAKGSKPRLHADMTCRGAFQAIGRACLHDLMLNSAVFETPDFVEGVHQARVAIRRLRAALTLFKPMLDDGTLVPVSSELKWLAGLLGAARDLDVMQLERPARASGDSGLADEIEARRAVAHRAVRDGFASARYRTFLVDLVAWIEDGPWQRLYADAADACVADVVTKRMRKRRKALVAAGRDMAHLDPGARHRIRIEAKKMRYMAEFFRDVPDVATPRKVYKKFIRSLEDLQLALGEMHDIEVEDAFLEGEAALARDAARGETAAGYLLAARTDTSKQLARAISAHEALVEAKPF